MNDPEPNISVNVDATNPGQFFACCGLLELADRLWPGAEGWFRNGTFFVKCDGTLIDALCILIMDPPKEVTRIECNGLEVKPIIAPLSFTFDGGASTAITLDAWTKIQSVRQETQVIANSPWNFWSGQQTSFSIWGTLREALAVQLAKLDSNDLVDLFHVRKFQKGRFGFDPGPAWNALDTGFSPNEQSMSVESSAAVELLAAVGIQRFRPIMNDDRDGFDYFTWHYPCAPCVAAAAMVGATRDRQSVRYRATVTSRGQYAALAFAYPLRKGASDE